MTAKAFNPAVLPPDYMKVQPAAAAADRAHFLLPGQMFTSKTPAAVSTILGSCVAVCLWDARLNIGGINHFLLPEGPDNGPNHLRYANAANATLLRQLLGLGCSIRNLQARIYGGAHAHVTAGAEAQSLGSRNVQAALDFLKSTGLPLLSQDVGGKKGRKLLYQTNLGTATVTLL